MDKGSLYSAITRLQEGIPALCLTDSLLPTQTAPRIQVKPTLGSPSLYLKVYAETWVLVFCAAIQQWVISDYGFSMKDSPSSTDHGCLFSAKWTVASSLLFAPLLTSHTGCSTNGADSEMKLIGSDLRAMPCFFHLHKKCSNTHIWVNVYNLKL